MTSPEAPPPTACCRCGHGRDHYMVSPEGDYTFSGWFRLMFGISACPTRIRYRCRRCDQVFDETTDPEVLAKHH